ncbi:MAG: hypothetical protein R2752_20205 [Vicinamibacterales bacterium]
MRLLTDRPLADRLASAGRAHALARLTLATTIDELDALYRREVAALGGRSGYRLWRSAGRAAWLGLHGRRLAQPLRDALMEYQRRTAPPAPRGLRRAKRLWDRARARYLRL